MRSVEKTWSGAGNSLGRSSPNTSATVRRSSSTQRRSCAIASRHCQAWRLHSASVVKARPAQNESRMKQNVLAAPLQHGRAKVAIQDDARLSRPGLERVNMAPQKVLHRLIEEELQIQSAGVGQRHDEAGQGALGAAHHHMAEVRPIDLRLLAGKHLQAQIGFADRRPHARYGPAQLHEAAGVTAVAHHLIEAGGTETRVLIQRLVEKRGIRIERAGARITATESLGLDRAAHRVGVEAEFAGDGADLPMFGVKQVADAHTDFRTDHAEMITFGEKCVATCPPNGPAARRLGNIAGHQADSLASDGEAPPCLVRAPPRKWRPRAHLPMMPGVRSKRNLDPSRLRRASVV